jgi:anaphase-promoting complex subunit 8
MPFYALYYFQKATALRPHDARMWCALGSTYESLDRTEDAIKSYKKALSGGENEGIALKKIAHLYSTLGDVRQAVEFYQKCYQEAKASDSVRQFNLME